LKEFINFFPLTLALSRREREFDRALLMKLILKKARTVPSLFFIRKGEG